MCRLASGIVTKDMRVLFHEMSESHEDIINLYKLSDFDIGTKRTFLRFEIHPLVSIASENSDDWEFILNEEDKHNLPKWYLKAQPEIIAKCKRELMYLIKKGRYLNFKGSIDLHEMPIQCLPDNMTVGEDLDIRLTRIKELPRNLTVLRDLNLSHTWIVFLPKSLIVKRDIYLRHTLILRPLNTNNIGGNVYR